MTHRLGHEKQDRRQRHRSVVRCCHERVAAAHVEPSCGEMLLKRIPKATIAPAEGGYASRPQHTGLQERRKLFAGVRDI